MRRLRRLRRLRQLRRLLRLRGAHDRWQGLNRGRWRNWGRWGRWGIGGHFALVTRLVIAFSGGLRWWHCAGRARRWRRRG